MFSSGITAKDVIAELKNEVDIAIPISDANYVLWLNVLEHLLYTEIIKEQKLYVQKIENASTNMLLLTDITVSDDECSVRFEDIYAVYADDVQLMKSTAMSGAIFPNTFFKQGGGIGLNIPENVKELKVVYFVKPALKTIDVGGNAMQQYISVPLEFIELVKDKLRGEAYKVANVDDQAAKWLNEYNVLLETFKVWVNNRAPQFGM